MITTSINTFNINTFNNDYNKNFINMPDSTIYNGYDSDTSENSIKSSGSINSSDSTDSSGSMDSSDSTNSYRSTDSYGSTNSSSSTGSKSTNYFDPINVSNNYQINHSINYYRRKKWSRSRTKQTYQTPQTPQTPQTSQISTKSNNCELCSVELGYTSNLSKDTPFIRFLIDKRINFCQLGASSHIAAFVPVSFNSRCCFIHHGKWKGRYR